MTIKSVIEKLGYEKDDKVVITHIDDIAMSHAANVAAFDCLDFGIAKCGSVIAVSGWLMEAAELYNKEKHDIGVHLSLTSEYPTFRWRPLSSVKREDGFFDEQGYLWRTSEAAEKNITSEAAELEMKAQIEHTINAGFEITHIDTHMGTVVYPKFVQSYLELAYEYKVPAFLPNLQKDQLIELGLSDHVHFIQNWMKELSNNGYPLIDHLLAKTLNPQEDKTGYYKELFDSLQPGLTHLLFHPAKMSSELRALCHEPKARNQDYEAFTDQMLKDYVESLDIHLIGYRDIKKYFTEIL